MLWKKTLKLLENYKTVLIFIPNNMESNMRKELNCLQHNFCLYARAYGYTPVVLNQGMIQKIRKEGDEKIVARAQEVPSPHTHSPTHPNEKLTFAEVLLYSIL